MQEFNDSDKKNEDEKRKSHKLELGIKLSVKSKITHSIASKKTRTVLVERKKKKIIHRPTYNKNVNFNKSKDQNQALTQQEISSREQALILDQQNKIKQKQEILNALNQKALDEKTKPQIVENQKQEISDTQNIDKNQKLDKNYQNSKQSPQTTIKQQNNKIRKSKQTNENTQQNNNEVKRNKSFPKDKKNDKTNIVYDDKLDKKNKTDIAGLKRDFSERRRKILTINNALDEDFRQRSIASIKRKREKEKLQKNRTNEKTHIAREVIIPDAITIAELASRMAKKSAQVIKFLLKQGQSLKENDFVDGDTAQIIVEEFGHITKRVSEADVEENIAINDIQHELLKKRPPIVTVMGHVDHGKTTLIDAIRKTNIVKSEHGGITQHIGAYQIEYKKEIITFIDTPGHEAFSQMRSRGAEITDIVIIVIAADEGIKPQTIEAIKHAKTAQVPIIIALNKVDKENIDKDNIYKQLMQQQIFVEKMGGEILNVEISAKNGINIDKLLEIIMLQAEIMEIKAVPTGKASAVVIDASIETGKGKVISAIIKQGELKKGQSIVVGKFWGKAKVILDHNKNEIKTATPGMPIEIQGVHGISQAGDILDVVDNESIAKQISEYRKRKIDIQNVMQKKSLSGAELISSMKIRRKKEIPIIIKAELDGSIEAIVDSLAKVGNKNTKAKIIIAAVGDVNENDVQIARAAGAFIYAFNVNPNQYAKELAKAENVNIIKYNVIYDLIEHAREYIAKNTEIYKEENIIGEATVLQFFKVTGVGRVAGCRIVKGKIESDKLVKVIRDDKILYNGNIDSLMHFTREVKEIKEGQECGIGIKKFQEIAVNDKIQCYDLHEIKESLD